MIKVDLSDFKRLGKDFSVLRKKELPHAARETLNTTAFAARKLWVSEMKTQLVLRNKFTERSARIDKARGVDIKGMQSVLGSVAKYMGETERGAKQTGRGHVGFPVPTRAAGGQIKSKTRTKPVRKASYLAAVSLSQRVTKGSRQVRNAATIAIALRKGKSHAFLDLGKKKGIFRLEGSKRGLRVRMLYDLSKRTTQAKAKPTLAAAVHAVGPLIPRIGGEAVIAQLKQRLLRRRGSR